MSKLAGTLLQHGAPVLKGILENAVGGIAGRIGGAIVGELADALGVPATETAIVDAIEADPIKATTIIRTIEEDAGRMAEATRDAVVSYHSVLTRDAESEGWLQSRWRPLFAVIFSVCFLMVVVTLCSAVWSNDVESLRGLADLAGFLIALFTTGAAVLGVYVWRRTDEKQAAA